MFACKNDRKYVIFGKADKYRKNMLEKRTNIKMRADVSTSSRIFYTRESERQHIFCYDKYAFNSSNVFFTPST